jgi:hypothetical protein
MLPMAVGQAPHVLAGGYDLPAALADLARRMCLVAFRVKVIDLKVLAFVLLDLALGHAFAVMRWPLPPLLLPEAFFLAVLGRHAHRASLAAGGRKPFRLQLTVWHPARHRPGGGRTSVRWRHQVFAYERPDIGRDTVAGYRGQPFEQPLHAIGPQFTGNREHHDIAGRGWVRPPW